VTVVDDGLFPASLVLALVLFAAVIFLL